MKPIPLFTSIPPSITRFDMAGRNVGEQYTKYCIKSWCSSGFNPISLNSSTEGIPKCFEQHIQNIYISDDAYAQYQKPVLYLRDFIEAILRNHEGVVAITNADIVLDLSEAERRTLESLNPNECIISKRIDVDVKEDRTGTVFSKGYDFFSFHTNVIRDFDASDFALGMPWWDHFLPLWLHMKGATSTRKINSVFHLKHQERWQYKYWLTVGKKFEKLLADSIRNNADQKFVNSYLARVSAARRSSKFSLQSYVKASIKAIVFRNLDFLIEPRIRGLSKVNISEIDAWRAK